MQADPLAWQQLRVDRLGQQRVAEHVAGAAGSGSSSCWSTASRRPSSSCSSFMPATAASSGWVTPGPAAAATRSSCWVRWPSRTTLVRSTSCRLGGSAPGRRRRRAAAPRRRTGCPRTGVDVVEQPGGRVGAQQAGQLLGQLGAGEARQLQPLHAAVAGQLAQQPAKRVQPIQLVAAEGAHQQHPARPKGGGEEGEQVAGGAVGPVQVLHDPQQRRGGGQPLDHPQQQLEQPPLARLAPATTAAAASPPQARSGSSRPSSARAGPATASSSAGSRSSARPRSASMTGANGRPSSPSGTQPPRSTRRPCPRCRRPAARPGGSCRPPPPRRSAPPAAGRRRQGQQLAQPRQLLGAADETAGRDLVGHAGPSMPRRF